MPASPIHPPIVLDPLVGQKVIFLWVSNSGLSWVKNTVQEVADETITVGRFKLRREGAIIMDGTPGHKFDMMGGRKQTNFDDIRPGDEITVMGYSVNGVYGMFTVAIEYRHPEGFLVTDKGWPVTREMGRFYRTQCSPGIKDIAVR